MTASQPGPGAPHPLDSKDSVNWGIRVTASWAVRGLVIATALYLLFHVIRTFGVVTVPVALALLGSALMSPLVGWMQSKGVPRALATVIAMVGGIALVASVLTFVVQAFIDGLPELQNKVSASISGVQRWLIEGPFKLRPDEITSTGDTLTKSLKSHSDALTTSALSTASTLTEILTGGLLTLFTLIFFLHGGRGIWEFLIKAVPEHTRDAVDVAGHRGFGSLVGYVRATVAVAGVDATGIGVGLGVLQVPLALPLAALVFLGAFIPIIGAVLTGIVAVLVALVTKGLVVALIVLGVVLAVQQLEGHVLQPLLLGRAVALHPVAVVLAIAAGTVVGGILGALLAVPTVAVLNSAIRSLIATREQANAEHLTASDPDGAEPGATDAHPVQG
ncbi:MAG: AI-2E family transporter [Mycobacteriaceae bacterium]